MSQNPTHTPGPWRIHNKHARFNPLILAGPEAAAQSILLAEVRNNDSRLVRGEADANARLIASAPELLAALQECVANMEDSESTLDCDGKPFSDYAAAKAAISKATGA